MPERHILPNPNPTLGLTWADLVRLTATTAGYLSHLDDVEVDFILWEHTAFPIADAPYILRQLEAFFDDVVSGSITQPSEDA